MKLILFIFSPVVFGVLFLAPLIAQVLTAFGFAWPDVNNLSIGLFLGASLGLIAQIRGSWIWIKP